MSIWLLFRRDVDECESMNDALMSAWATQEWSDDDWFDRIEEVSASGDVISVITDSSPVYRAFEEEREQERRDREKVNPPKPFIGSITVDDRPLASFYGDDSDARMVAEYDRLLPYLGDRLAISRPRYRW